MANYGAPVWIHDLKLVRTSKLFQQIEHHLACKSIKAYCTTKHSDAMLLSGLCPLLIYAQKRDLAYRIKDLPKKERKERANNFQAAALDDAKSAQIDDLSNNLKSFIGNCREIKTTNWIHFAAVLFLTNRGFFIKRSGKDVDGNNKRCPLCTSEEKGDPVHTLLTCPAFILERETIASAGIEYIDDLESIFDCEIKAEAFHQICKIILYKIRKNNLE
jgi:hypothetical protein